MKNRRDLRLPLGMVLTLMMPLQAQAQAQAQSLPELPEIGMEPGKMAPDFRLPKLSGGHGRLSDYRGKKILLFHFASW